MNEIEEIKKEIGKACNREGIAKHCPERIAEALYNAGYRKADKVRKETAREILHKLYCEEQVWTIIEGTDDNGFTEEGYCDTDVLDTLNKLAKEYGVEVEE